MPASSQTMMDNGLGGDGNLHLFLGSGCGQRGLLPNATKPEKGKAVSTRKYGGPGRDRTDDLFHAMELQNTYLADGKGVKSRTSRQEPLKSARFATKMLPKRVLPICYQIDSGQGLTAGEQPFFIILSTIALSVSQRKGSYKT